MTTHREELLHALAVLSDENSELRLGQLVKNLATVARGTQVEAIWDCEDEELLATANRFVEHDTARKASRA
ncbi:MAG: hypothetical protein ACHRXM_03665 [Isosphaerales bacterium]